MSNTVTESIFAGKSVTVPLADVQHIELHPQDAIYVITKHTRWDCERDVWANAIWINEPEATDFRRAWCNYRAELEADTLMDLAPERNPPLLEGRDQLGKILRYYASQPYADSCNETVRVKAVLLTTAADEIERLQTENWQLRQACGYPIPADKETPQNPFKCGICDARSQSSGGQK